MMKSKKSSPKSKWAEFAASDGTFDFEALSDEQKEELYRECESFGGDKTDAPLTLPQCRLHERAARGRPRKGKGAKVVSLNIEKNLLHRAERLAKSRGLSRSELFSRGLRAMLAVAGAA